MLLTEREKQVIELLAQGYNASGIADKLCISKKSAKAHLHNIYEKNLIVRESIKAGINLRCALNIIIGAISLRIV